MGRIITFSNQKGGVGKTTSAINIASYVAQEGKKVLLADIDPQGNATTGLGVAKNLLDFTMYDVLTGDASAKDAIIESSVKNLDVLPCTNDLVGAEIALVKVKDREFVLKTALDKVKDEYDFVFVDCPPSLGLLTLNALTACDGVIIPIQSEFYALEGLSQLINTIKIVTQRTNPSIKIEGVILTMYDGRSIMSRQVSAEITRFFGAKVYENPVPRNIKVAEAPSFGNPISVHAPKSAGAQAYQNIARQFLERESQK